MSLKNFYEIIGKEFKDNNKYYNPHAKDKGIPKHPFRSVIVGGSGSYKTNSALNIIFQGKNIEKIYLYAKTLDEPLYRALIATYENAGLKAKQNLITFSDNPADIVTPEELDKTKQNLIIFDDMITCSKKEHKKIEDIFVRCRKFNCSVIYISQSYHAIPKIIRLNCTHFILKSINSVKDMKLLVRDTGNTKTIQELQEIYDKSTQGTDLLMIDLTASEKDKYKKNFIIPM